MRSFNLIACVSENRVIGLRGRVPWSLPEDQRFLRRQTAGQVVLMGRICFETWPHATRDGRRSVVVTSRRELGREGVRVAASLDDAFAIADRLDGEIYVCGGEQIFAESIGRPEARRLHLTLLHAEVEGDRFFPEWRPLFPREVERRPGADGPWRYEFLTLEK